MRRLYLQIYLTVVGCLLLFALLLSAAWVLLPESGAQRRGMEGLALLAGDLLPPAGRPLPELELALERLADQLHSDLAVRAPDGLTLAAVGRPIPAPSTTLRESGRYRVRGSGPIAALRLPDGRWLLARPVHPPFGLRPATHVLGGLGILAVAIALGAFPIVRRLTQRLERLRARVDELGSGDLAARVDEEGRDEVAALARSFNRAAAQIERLVGAQKTLLASASHELRTPLTRIRVATELLGEARPELRDRVARDVAELDALIGELLLASRLDTLEAVEGREEIDLLALAAEEAARYDADVAGDPVLVRGDRKLLHHLVRNLLENARRHGSAPGAPVEIRVSREADGGARIRVRDRGHGVPVEERERIFEPFYQPAGLREGEAGGVGLGLALVRRIARLHGGDAVCIARDGGGSSFEVALPARESSSQATEAGRDSRIRPELPYG
jgi:signal transduction histidine kinase